MQKKMEKKCFATLFQKCQKCNASGILGPFSGNILDNFCQLLTPFSYIGNAFKMSKSSLIYYISGDIILILRPVS